MRTRKIFRMILIGYWVSVGINLGVSTWSSKLISPDFFAVFQSVDIDVHPTLRSVALIVGVLCPIILVISSTMLFNFRSGARRYFLGALVVMWMTGFFLGPVVRLSWVYPFSELHVFLGGCVVAASYLGGAMEDPLPEVEQVFG
nr:hypothetical protein [Candidatus Krumholzibacteria bacterium]